VIKASPQILYEAFTSPKALETWLAPGDMTGKVHHFDHREGGGYEMSLFYPDTEQGAPGKTAGKEDRFVARFVTLDPGRKIVEAVRFDSSDAHFQGEMIMEVFFDPAYGGTRVTIIFKDIPAGIRPEDNEKGTELSLQKLENYVAGMAGKP
jgi:uncharacterized protein YndB with AHSA1/START domain